MGPKHVTNLTALLLSIVILVSSALPIGASVRAQTRTRVIASFSILADVVHEIAGDAADVDALMSVGQDPHSFQPTPKDVVALSEADAVFIVGINFEENLMPVLNEAGGDRVTIVSECVPVRLFGNAQRDQINTDVNPVHDSIDMAEQCAAHHMLIDAAFAVEANHDDQVSEPHEHDEFMGMLYEGICGEDAREHGEAGSCDPHVWMDPTNVALWTLMIRDTLSELDPANAEHYAATADAYISELAQLDQEIHKLLAPISEAYRYIVTNHQALNYFAARYELHLVGTIIPGGSTGAEPSTQDVVNLITTIQEFGVHAIYTETTVDESLAEQIAIETGADIVRLYTGSLSGPDEPASTYLSYMQFNANQIADSLQ